MGPDACQAEVGELHDAFDAHQNVPGRHISMDHASNVAVAEGMRVLKCRCDAVSDPQDLFGRQRPLLAQHPQIHTVDEREHHVGPIGLEVVIQDVHQVPMLKSTGNARLTDEQLPTLGIFGAVCMQPLEAPPAFGAVVA